ncbi:hypothetical protein EC991_011450 [Linnemannia zychae]|nr:hypothetical protein EC991_011450 [Linnemannia zychae]
MTHRTTSTATHTTATAPRHQLLPRQQQTYSTSTPTSSTAATASSTATSSSSTSPALTRRYLLSDQPRNQYNQQQQHQQQQQQQQHLAANDNTELDWKYLSATETYTSEFSSVASDEYEEDGATTTTTNTGHNSAQVSDSSAGSRSRGVAFTVQRNSNGGSSGRSGSQVGGSAASRTFLVPTTTSSSTSSTAAGLSSSFKEADDSTDTIKGMRARALDKVNGRKPSSSNLSSSSGNLLVGSNDFNPYRRNVATSYSANSGGGSGAATENGRTYSGQEASIGGGVGTASSKIKRKSVGLSPPERSQSLRITTNTATANSNTTKTSQSSEAHPSSPPSLLRKRTSGPVKTSQQQQQQQLQQQGLFTSEDDSEVPGQQSVYQDRTRYASEGGVLVSEIKALKARVQELEMERMNRSLSSVQVQVQSPQVMTPKSMDHSTTSFLPSNDSLQQAQGQLSASSSVSHSEKLQQIIQKHRGSSVSHDLANPRSPVISAVSDNEGARDPATTRTSGGAGRLEPSLSITSPVRSPMLASSTLSSSRQPTTQHVDLLNVALKNYERWTASATPGTTAAAGVNGNPSFQAINRVATNAINMNQTIRAWVKADVSLVESSSMNALQRASDEQIRSLTEFLLAATRTPHPSATSAADRSSSNNNPVSDTESVNGGGGGGSVISRPYSPRLSTTTHHRFGQGQRLSLGMAASEFGTGAFDPNNPPYPTRPLSTMSMEPYEVLNHGQGGGVATVVGNGMASSGYLSRTNSLASSSNFSEARARSTGPNNVRHSQGGGGYTSDYGYDRQQPSAAFQGLGLSRNQVQQQQQQQQVGGTYSSRESSPPQEDLRGPVPRRQASGLLAASRTLQPPQHPSLTTAGGSDDVGSNTPTGQGQHLTRRQASVRNIMARYSQSGVRSPNMSGYDQGELQDSAIDQPQDGGGRPMSMSQYDEDGGPRSPLFHARRVGQAVESFVQDQQQHQHQYRSRHRQEDVISASESSFGPGHAQANMQTQARAGASIRRPLSQQDHRRNMAGSRLSEPGDGRQGYASLGVRAGQRYANVHGGAFSEDENASASDWGGSQRGNSGGVVIVNPQRASMDSYSARLRQFRGRHEQQLPFHQEGLSFEEPQQEFAEGVEVEAGDALATGPVPRFAQRQPRYMTQSQYLDKPSPHRQGFQHQQQHHQDMMMSTPSLPSPNSSPSSSARLDAPSLMMSLSNHGQGGGLSAGISSTSLSSAGGGGSGVDGRYHLSPRGPGGSSTFPRQGVTGLGDEGLYHGHQQQQQQSLVGAAGAGRRAPMGTLQAAQ